MAILEGYRTLLPLMDLLEEAVAMGVPVELGAPVIHCRMFEDNSGALQMAGLPKMRPRMQQITVKYHHLCNAVAHQECQFNTWPQRTSWEMHSPRTC
jgi:hypothetical protein